MAYISILNKGYASRFCHRTKTTFIVKTESCLKLALGRLSFLSNYRDECICVVLNQANLTSKAIKLCCRSLMEIPGKVENVVTYNVQGTTCMNCTALNVFVCISTFFSCSHFMRSLNTKLIIIHFNVK